MVPVFLHMVASGDHPQWMFERHATSVSRFVLDSELISPPFGSEFPIKDVPRLTIKASSHCLPAYQLRQRAMVRVAP